MVIGVDFETADHVDNNVETPVLCHLVAAQVACPPLTSVATLTMQLLPD